MNYYYQLLKLNDSLKFLVSGCHCDILVIGDDIFSYVPSILCCS